MRLCDRLDVGQIEGAFAMGLGLNLSEEVLYNDDGTLLTNDTWEYKVSCNRIPHAHVSVCLARSDTFTHALTLIYFLLC